MSGQKIYYQKRIEKWIEKAKKDFNLNASEFAQLTAIEFLEKEYPQFRVIADAIRMEKQEENSTWEK